MNLINVANFFLTLKSISQRFRIRFKVLGKDGKEEFYNELKQSI